MFQDRQQRAPIRAGAAQFTVAGKLETAGFQSCSRLTGNEFSSLSTVFTQSRQFGLRRRQALMEARIGHNITPKSIYRLSWCFSWGWPGRLVLRGFGDIGDGRMRDGKTESSPIADIAVVGMAVRLPGARAEQIALFEAA